MTKLSTVTVKLNSFRNYTIPAAIDTENNAVTYIMTAEKKTSLDFIKLLDQKVIQIIPTMFSQVGTHSLVIKLYDGQDYS